MNINRFKQLATDCGATIHSAVLLGYYLHIDTNQASEPKIREMLGIMKVNKIIVLKKGADGKHLDGGHHHRIVAVFN